jgi:aryl-alcohol dehydrogenase-like predicted oxidoreductase
MTLHPTPGQLPTRTLGRELRVAAIGFGAMGMSEFYGPSDDEASLRLLHEALDRGVTMIDTADIYGRGHNETLLGRLLAASSVRAARQPLCIATKCGIDRPVDAAYARRINNRPDYIRSCCEASLRRLGVECIDLYYLHRVDPQADLAATMQCMSDLVREGKIRYVGLCEVSAPTLAKAHALHPITAIQSEYSLWTRDVEEAVLPLTRELGIGLVAYSPLGRGFLTGKVTDTDGLAADDFRRSNPRFAKDNLDHNLERLRALDALAARVGATKSQLALAWLLSRGPSIVPIPGTRRSSYLQENLAAAHLELAPADLQTIDHVMPPGAVRGERYTAEGMKGINV